jgi:ferritin
MLSKKMTKALNRQINREIYSGYLYLAMASYAKDSGLSGVANWFSVQLQEELSHAQKFYNYIQQRNGKVTLESIEEPGQRFSSVTDLFEKTLDHEKKVTAMINDLVSLALEEKDRATEIMLQWFVTEQVEEEANANDILQRLKTFGENGNALLMIDQELGQRVFTPPPAEG